MPSIKWISSPYDENYQIIYDINHLKFFINWLPVLNEHEKFYCALFARKKYCEDCIKASDKRQLKRFLTTKELLIPKIRQLEVAEGAYMLNKHGDVAPQESLALYITPNPRSMLKATYASIRRLTDIIECQAKNANIHQEVMSCIQRSCSRKLYLDFDIDDKDFDLSLVADYINSDAVWVLTTRGGYHVLVMLSKVEDKYRKTFYQDLLNLGCDKVGDQLMPVPGCVQGQFSPVLGRLDEILDRKRREAYR